MLLYEKDGAVTAHDRQITAVSLLGAAQVVESTVCVDSDSPSDTSLQHDDVPETVPVADIEGDFSDGGVSESPYGPDRPACEEEQSGDEDTYPNIDTTLIGLLTNGAILSSVECDAAARTWEAKVWAVSISVLS
jgi:hypothetical protein